MSAPTPRAGRDEWGRERSEPRGSSHEEAAALRSTRGATGRSPGGCEATARTQVRGASLRAQRASRPEGQQ